jgi:hypothetical protein
VAASKRSVIIVFVGAALVAVTAGLNWAQNEMNVQFHGFDDTRGVTVLSPTFDLSKDFSDRTGVRLKFGVDAITAASDGCARCHPSGANNSRVAFGASVVKKYGDTKFTYGGEYGQENFYRATTGLASISRDLNKGNTTVAGGFAFSLNQPQLHPTDTTENQFATNAFVSATQTVTKTTIVQGGYEFGNINGYQTDPFLRVPVNGVLVVGNVPDLRSRHTLTARVRQALPADTYLEADYRRYHDTWAIDSNTFSLGLSHHFSPQLLLGFAYRWYDQTGAYFYQPSYTGSPQYYTSDFRLVPFDSGLYSGRITITPKDRIFGLPKGTALVGSYERYRSSTGFEAAIFTTSIKIPY